MSQFSPSNARSRQLVERRRDKKQESFFECAHRNKKWRVNVCDVALYKRDEACGVVRGITYPPLKKERTQKRIDDRKNG